MIDAVGVVVPAHDEEELLLRCLAALDAAATASTLRQPPPRVHLVVVLDNCTDASADIARRAGVHTVALEARNVGRARAAGVARVLKLETGPRPNESGWPAPTPIPRCRPTG